jgi:2-octaprenyl-6-methoxyphenol hydroxylase
MSNTTPDIFISGGGIAGLVAGLGFAHQGATVTIADPAPPPGDDDMGDLRSTAYLQPARALLEEIGIWDRLSPKATPLETLRVINCTGSPPAPRITRAFESDDLGAPAFGWNLPNTLTRRVLAKAAVDHPQIDLRFGTGFKSRLARDTEARITLSDGHRLSTKLAIAADGRNSPLREAADIPVQTTRYGQKALAFAVTHPDPHHNISTELYLDGGAFVLVPLPDHEGQPASAVVWMNDGPEALRLQSLSEADFNTAASDRATHILGPLTLITKRQLWPVITQTAQSLTAKRTALIAEAAHVLPPIGAQGLNTSLMDVRLLLDLAEKAPDTLGMRAYLDQFAKTRARDIAARAKVIDLYNRICRSDAAPVQTLRSAGLRLVHDIKPLRHTIMRAGLGT